MMRYIKLLGKHFALELSSEMAYKTNFLIKAFSMMLIDVVGPVFALLIYSATSGIPGWSFEEFIFFQGTFILVMGLGHVFMFSLPYIVVENVVEGTFDTFLIRPYRPLLYLTFTSIDLDGFPELVVGLALIIWSSIRMNLSFLSVQGLSFIFLIALALIFVYSMMVFIGSLAFLVVRSYSLGRIFFTLIDLGRYPLAIYGFGLRFVLTFLIPIAMVSNYPTSAFLKGMSFSSIFILIIPIVGFLMFNLVLWCLAMRKYSSAGG